MSTALERRPLDKRELIGLARYDSMIRAIVECHEVDEVKQIHDVSAALEKYAKQAKNYEAELRAMDVRIRASTRAGFLIAQGQKNGTIATQGDYGKNRSQTSSAAKSENGKPKTLGQLGISGDQSSQWKELAGFDPEEVEQHLPMKTGKRTSEKKIIREMRPKRDPEAERQQKLKTLALRVWGRVRDLSETAEDASIREIVSAMDKQLLDGVGKSIPKAEKFLAELEKEIRREKEKKS